MHSLDDAKNIAKNILNKKVSIMKNEELTLEIIRLKCYNLQ